MPTNAWDGDESFIVGTLDEVTRDGEYWTLHSDGGSFGYEAAQAPDFEPHVGDEVRYYGRGLGYAIRGLMIRGLMIYYRTEAEEEARHAAWVAEKHAERQRKFDEGGRAELDAKYAALPPIFQARIDKYRRNNPDFRVEYEPYEMFCCEEAVKLAAHVGTVEAMEHYVSLASQETFEADRARWDAEWEEQKAIDRAAGLALDEHSGNTHGAAVSLAFWYLKQPENVERMHGALAPLVGSWEYGDVPPDEVE